MANRWKGNIVSANATTSDGTNYTGKANGAWGLNSQIQQKQAGLWAKGVGAPSTPIIGTATGLDSSAAINFTPSSFSGGGTVTYTATSTPNGITGNSTTSPITVNGLTNGTVYTFTVHASNSLGYTSPESASSNSVTPSNSAIFVGNDITPFISAYTWSSSSGAGAKFSDPSTLPTASVRGVSINSAATAVSFCTDNSPYINAYAWNATSGFGTKYANPSTLPLGNGNDVVFNSAGNLVAISYAVSSPYSAVYPWSSGFGTKYANPATVLTSQAFMATFNADSTAIAYQISASPFITAFAWSSGFGTKYADPSTTPSGGAQGAVVFSPNGANIIQGNSTSPYLAAYPWSNGFGTKYANPSTLPTSGVQGLCFNPTGSVVGAGLASNPYIIAYPWSNGFGTKYTNPSSIGTSLAGAAKCAFNNTGTSIAVGNYDEGTTKAILGYAWSNGFGTKYSAVSLDYGFTVTFSPY